MGLYDRTNDWPEGALEIIARTIPNYKKRFVLGQSCNFKFSSKYFFTDKEIVVLSYNRVHHVFVAWNAHIHNHIHQNVDSVVLTASGPRGGLQGDEIKCVYIYRNTYGFEKITFIGKDALYEFCINFDYYLTPNTSDSEFRSPALYVSDKDELEKLEAGGNVPISFTARVKDNISRLRRDSTFRKRVLQDYGKRCIICGCTEEKILEAAHIVDVQYDNDDTTGNGMCLCCNHHKLYDSGLLSIDWKNGIFSCSSEPEQSMPWYITAREREFKLFLPE